MAKFSRLLLGGVVGAGLAYLFSRKDVRRRLMGGGQGQLPAPGAPPTSIPVTYPTRVTEPAEAAAEVPVSEAPVSDAPVAAAPAAEDLESQIEETRRQVEEQLEEPFSASAIAGEEPAVTTEEETLVEEAEATVEPEVREEPAATEVPISEEEIDTGEAPEILLEEEAISIIETSREEQEEADAEALTEAVETNGIEAPVEETVELEAVKNEVVEAEETPELEAEKTVQFDAGVVSVPETDEFADLKTPAAGEPTTAEEEISQAAPEPESGPAPSQIDRDEMRRRIDETRARLKAKAFDALVSGETFIEPETEEGREKHKAADVDIDSEIEEQIDRSLREED